MIILSDLTEYAPNELTPTIAVEYSIDILIDLEGVNPFDNTDVFQYYIEASPAVLDAIAADPNYEVIPE